MNQGSVEKDKAEQIARAKWDAMAQAEKTIYKDYFNQK